MEKSNYLSIEGPPACGKTFLARHLAEKYRASLILDPTGDNPFLQDFHANPSRYAFLTQIFYLVKRYQELKELSQPDLFASRVVADFHFARDEIFARLSLSQRELDLYKSLAGLMEREIPVPDLAVYLQIAPSQMETRIVNQKKGPGAEYSRQYADRLCTALDHYFFHYTASPLLIVNANSLDFENRTADLELVASEIEKTSFGTRYFTPSPRDVLL